MIPMLEPKEQQLLNDILDTVIFIKDNAVSKGEFNDLKSEFNDLKSKVTTMHATMVTKDYLDGKLADLRGDLVVLTRKEDTKLKELVEILKKKKILTDDDVKHLLTMEPFPQLML